MYMRISRAQIDPAQADALDAFRGEVNAALQQLPGCRAVYQAGDRARGTTIAVTLWDTEEHARFPREALGDLARRIQAAALQMEAPEIFEVIESAVNV